MRGRWLLALVATLVALGAAEFAARIAFDAPEPENITPVPDGIRMEPDFPGVPYVLRPNARVVHQFPDDPRGYFDPGATLTYATNGLGFRGPETTLDKPSGAFRIVGIGDSFTFGTGVRDSDTFLAVAGRRLAVEALNLGVMGYDTVHEVALLEHRGFALDPDLVVVCFFLNDAGGGAVHRFLNVEARPDAGWLRRSSVLADRIAIAFERRRGAAELVAAYQDSLRSDAPGWIDARRALVHAKALADAHDVPIVLMIFPVLWRLSDDYPFTGIHESVASFATEAGIPVLDLLPHFRRFDGPELWVHPTNQHPNEAAHAIAGDALSAFLHERGLVRQ